MKTAVVIPVKDRAETFRRCLASVLRANGGLRDLHIAQDGADAETRSRIRKVIREEMARCPGTTVETFTREETNLGLNLIEARARLFDDYGYERVHLIEDDLEVATHYFAVIEAASAWAAGRYHNVGIVNSDCFCLLSRQEKELVAGFLVDNACHMNHYLMDRAVWRSVAPFLMEYREFLVGRTYREKDAEAIRRWFRSHLDRLGPAGEGEIPNGYEVRLYFEDPRVATGQDAATRLALELAGKRHLALQVNRVRCIPSVGEHVTPAWFHQRGYDAVEIFDDPADASRNAFRLLVRPPIRKTG